MTTSPPQRRVAPPICVHRALQTEPMVRLVGTDLLNQVGCEARNWEWHDSSSNAIAGHSRGKGV